MTEEKYLDPSADFQVYANNDNFYMPPAQDPDIIQEWRVFPKVEIPNVEINSIQESITKKYDITLMFKQLRNAS